LASASAEIRGAAIRALCALQGEDGVEQITPYAADANPIVQQQALIGLLRYGGISGIVAAAEQLATLGRSTAVGDRSAAAHIIGAVGNQHFYQPLIPLLQDDSVAVRNAALIAAASAPHPNLVPLLIANLEHSVTRSAATEALIAAGKNILPPLQAALRGSTPLEPVVLTHLMRVAGSLPATAIGPLLSEHLTYPDPDLRGVIQRAALSSGYRLDQDQSGKAAMNSALELEAQTTQRILTALADLAGDDDGLQAVQRALDDALILAQQRVLLLLRLFYDSQALARVGDLLTGARGADQSLALELLDVTLIPEHKIALAVIDPQLSREKRQDRLARVADVAPASRQERLQELATDPDHVWQQGWLRACAVYAIGRIGLLTLAEAVTTLQDDADPTVRETVIWTLEQLQTTDS
jgi:HEAT repeat protein